MSSCNGCAFDDPEFDHHHQYMNIWRNIVQITHIDGKSFQTEHAAFRYMRDEVGLEAKDALRYLNLIPTKYN